MNKNIPHTFGCNCEGCWNAKYDKRQAYRIAYLTREVKRRSRFAKGYPDHVTLDGRHQFTWDEDRLLHSHRKELRTLQMIIASNERL